MKGWELWKLMKYRFQLKYKKQMLFEDEILGVGVVEVQEANIIKVDNFNFVLGEILRVVTVKYFLG